MFLSFLLMTQIHFYLNQILQTYYLNLFNLILFLMILNLILIQLDLMIQIHQYQSIQTFSLLLNFELLLHPTIYKIKPIQIILFVLVYLIIFMPIPLFQSISFHPKIQLFYIMNVYPINLILEHLKIIEIHPKSMNHPNHHQMFSFFIS